VRLTVTQFHFILPNPRQLPILVPISKERFGVRQSRDAILFVFSATNRNAHGCFVCLRFIKQWQWLSFSFPLSTFLSALLHSSLSGTSRGQCPDRNFLTQKIDLSVCLCKTIGIACRNDLFTVQMSPAAEESARAGMSSLGRVLFDLSGEAMATAATLARQVAPPVTTFITWVAAQFD
jgi:hypothetical protein